MAWGAPYLYYLFLDLTQLQIQVKNVSHFVFRLNDFAYNICFHYNYYYYYYYYYCYNYQVFVDNDLFDYFDYGDYYNYCSYSWNCYWNCCCLHDFDCVDYCYEHVYCNCYDLFDFDYDYIYLIGYSSCCSCANEVGFVVVDCFDYKHVLVGYCDDFGYLYSGYTN